MTRRSVPAISPMASTVGYSRAVRVGDTIHVAGTAAIGAEDLDVYGQTRRCLEIVLAALEELGATAADVVRTRVYLVDAADWEEAGRAHGEVFGEVQPASAMLVISGLLDPRWRVEIEADAVLSP